MFEEDEDLTTLLARRNEGGIGRNERWLVSGEDEVEKALAKGEMA